MKNDFAQHLQQGGERLLRDLHQLLEDAEGVLRHSARDAGEGYEEARQRLQESVEAARARLATWPETVRASSERAAREVGRYAGEHPWHVIGAAAAVGALLALALRGRDSD